MLEQLARDHICKTITTHQRIIDIRDLAATKPKERGHYASTDTEDAAKFIVGGIYPLTEDEVAIRGMGDMILRDYEKDPVNTKSSCINMPPRHTK